VASIKKKIVRKIFMRCTIEDDMNIQVDVVNLNKGEVSNRYKIARDVPKTTGS